MAKNVVEVDVVSDVMCPWCYIGKRRLEKALAQIDPAIEVKIMWRPFQLDPTIPPQGRDRQLYLSQKFGTPEQIAEKYDPIVNAGKEEGIDFNFNGIKLSPNTLNAHRVLHWAQAEGVQDQVSEALFKAYFIDNLDLTDNAVLAEIAAGAGMDRDVVARLLAGDADVKSVQDELAHYRKMGVQSVPTMIIGKKYAVVGAQPADTIAEVISGVYLERQQAAG